MRPDRFTVMRTAGDLVIAGLLAFFVMAPGLSEKVWAQGQSASAVLAGRVQDGTGASVSEATVTLSNAETHFSRVFTTATDGTYAFTLIPAGQYDLLVRKNGFKPYLQKGIVLGVAESATQNVALGIGAVTDQVTVEGLAPLLNTTNANVDSTVTARQAVDLPLNWRNIYQLTTLDSSVQNSNVGQVAGVGGNSGNAEQDGGLFNFGGGRFGTTAFLLDGHWDAAGDWDALIYVPSVDEVQEFKIQTYAFSAQYGWSTGNVVNAITKSGNSHFHGSAYEFNRNSALDANTYFNDVNRIPKPSFTRNQYGFTVGGPLILPRVYNGKDKTYVFGALELLRQEYPYTQVGTIPTDAFRKGDFSAQLGSQIGTDALGRPILSGAIYNPFSTRAIAAGQVDPVTGLKAQETGVIRDPFPGNLIPQGMVDKVATNMLPFWPQPTNGALTNNFSGSANLPVRSTRYTVRVDQKLSDKSSLFARWSREWLVRDVSGAFYGATNPAGPGSTTPNDRWDAAGSYTRTFSPTFVMNITGGWNRWVEIFNPQGYGFAPSTLGLPASLDANKIFPTVAPAGFLGLNNGLNGSAKSFAPREARSIAIDFTKVRGNHLLSMGWTGIWLTLNDGGTTPAVFPFGPDMTAGPDPTATALGTGSSFASFLLGTGDAGGAATLNANASIEKRLFGWYFQDDWKVSKKMTLNLGLRYDFQLAPTERYNRLTYFEPNETNPLSADVKFPVNGALNFVGGPNRRGIYEPQFTNFAPRLGVAYQAAQKLVLRGGFGIYYTPAIEQGDYQGLNLYGFSQATSWVATLDGIHPNNLLSNPFPTGLIQPAGKADGLLTQVGEDINAIQPKRDTPYVEQWMGGFQFAPSRNDNIDISYIGNHGVKLIFGPTGAAVQQNQLPIQDLSRGLALLNPVANPFAGFITNSACGLDQPTVTAQQLLRPFPQFCDISVVQQPSDSSSYNALRANYTHRWSGGLQVLASFTWSKYLDESSGPEGWATVNSTQILNSYDLAKERSLDYNDIPKSLVLSYIYALPVGHGKKFGSSMNKVVDGFVGGWQVSGVTTFKSGFPVAIGTLVNNSGTISGGQRPNIVGDPNRGSCPGLNGGPPIPVHTVNCWFNTSAFTQPAAFTLGDAPRTLSNMRVQGINNWDLGVEKWFNIKEKARVQFRTEFFNAFNRVYLFAPDSNLFSPTFGSIQNAGLQRQVQLGVKGYW
jgi:hypothetical protein